MIFPCSPSPAARPGSVRPRPARRRPPAAAFALAAIALLPAAPALAQSPVSAVAVSPGPARVPVVFADGHDTDGRDRGRPVVLVAGALGVTPEVFRAAFSHVHPAGVNSGGPTDEQARANKAALMSALGPSGVTDERLNTVSNRYRYVRSRGELWPTRSAVAYALVADGKVTGFVITDGGYGYSSPPTVTVSGVAEIAPVVRLAFTKDFETNGSVAAITIR